MTRIVPLNKETYRTLKVDGRAAAAYGDERRFVQAIVKEFPLLAVHYPILFSKDPQTGQFYCGAMLGFDENENLFLEDWQQREFYRPLYLQRGIFDGLKNFRELEARISALATAKNQTRNNPL